MSFMFIVVVLYSCAAVIVYSLGHISAVLFLIIIVFYVTFILWCYQ